MDVTLPAFLIHDQCLLVVHAEFWSDAGEAAEGSVERLDPPHPFLVLDRGHGLDHSYDSPDEPFPLGQEFPPMCQVTFRGRPILVEQPKRAFSEHIAEFLSSGALRMVGVVGTLEDSSYGRYRLQPLSSIQYEEPVLVVNVREKGAVAFDVDGKGSPTNERVLSAACFAEGVAHYRVVRKASNAKPNGSVGVQQADGPAQIGRIGHMYVVI